MSEGIKFSSGSYVEKRGVVEDALSLRRFDKVKSGTMFNIARPAFRAGQVLNKMGSVSDLKPNNRKGLGNKDITRTNFIAPSIRGREILDFERLQAQDIETGGIKVQLGDKTIEKLFKVQVDDPTDVAWIEQKNRRLQAGETLQQIKENPPFGRPQRKISKMTNFGDMKMSLDDKIEQLSQAVSQGVADSQQERARIAFQLATILGNVDNLQRLAMPQFIQIQQTVARLGINAKWQSYFRDLGRIVDGATFNANKGPIVMFLLSNIPQGRSLNEPILSYNSNSNSYRPVGLLQLFQMGGNNRYLDLQDRTIDTDVSLGLKGIDVDDIDFPGANPVQPAPGLLNVFN